MNDSGHRSLQELEQGLELITRSPHNDGTLDAIVIRPETDQRTALTTGQLNVVQGLEGDNWHTRGSRSTRDGRADPDAQVTLMNARAIELIAGNRKRWTLAGDQLYVDLDLSVENLPAGAQIAIGSAILEITAKPHTGCKKFADRFGVSAVRFVNSVVGKRLRLRGVNAKVVRSGEIHLGARITKLGYAAVQLNSARDSLQSHQGINEK